MRYAFADAHIHSDGDGNCHIDSDGNRNGNSHANSDANGNCNGNSHANSDANGNCYSNRDTTAADYTDATASADTAATSLIGLNIMSWELARQLASSCTPALRSLSVRPDSCQTVADKIIEKSIDLVWSG